MLAGVSGGLLKDDVAKNDQKKDMGAKICSIVGHGDWRRGM